MDIKLSEKEVQELIQYIGNIPTTYGADLMNFFKSKLAISKEEAKLSEEQPQETPKK